MKLWVLALVLAASHALAAMPSAEDQIGEESVPACYPLGAPHCSLRGDIVN